MHSPQLRALPFSRKPLPALALAVHLACAGLIVAGIQPAQAQQAGSTASYTIPAGSLAEALSLFAQQSGTPLSFEADRLQGLQTRGLQGNYSVERGYYVLLQGSGFRIGKTPAGYVLLPAASNAGDAAPDDSVLPQVTVMANQLGEISEGTGSYTAGAIATATRLVLTPRETPQSVSVITRQKMDDFNLTSIDSVMAHTPGISIVTWDSERTEYYSRGFAIQNFQYDGIPMQRDSAYSAGNTLSDMAIYDRVEVLKGATGLLTGSGDPGATINLVRKKPTRQFQGHVAVGAGSWDNYRTEVDVGGAVNESGSLRARAVATYQDRHSHLDRYQRDTTVFYGILEADLGPRTLLTLGADYQNNKPRGSTWGGIPIHDSNGNFNDMPRSFNNGANWSHWEQYTRTAFATLEHQLENGWVAKMQLNHQINGYDANLGAAAAGYPNPANGTGTELWVGQYIGRTTSDAADVYVSGPFSLVGREHELVIGGSFAKRRWKNDGYWNLPGYDFTVPDYYQWQGNAPEPAWGAPDYSNNETTREHGLYTTARWNLRDDLKLITGGRWSSYRNRDQELDESGVFVPYLGVVYDLDQNYSVYASYTGIFKPQSAQDEQGRTLDPLEGKNREIGLKAAFLDGRLNASAAYFDLVQDNFALATGGVTPRGTPAFRAAQGVKTRGYELEISGQLSPAWQVQAGYTHSVSRQQGERVTTLNPANQFSFFTSYKLQGQWQGLTLGGGARWQDKSWSMAYLPDNSSVKHVTPSYWLLDAMASYQFSDNLSGSVNVNNLLDKKYHTVFDWYSTYTWGEPRSVMLNLKYTF
ncbi:TonB-dependent siderophore receptor [Oxalicibacterium flavum]|nr:TonB-dependent siderophore receptor [Oxalicibacterium flavum]